ncbi:MAG: ABC-F family ATP-binding cassette domain-containing protein [Bacteroidia bacterium]
MNLISVEELTKSYADRPLFDSLNFGLALGDKVAIVGKNGAGKSTLMKIMAQLVPADGGLVTHRKGTRVGYLPQVPKLDENDTVMANLFDENNEIAKLVLDYESALVNESKADQLPDLLEKMEHHDAWDFEAKAKQVIGKLGIEDTEQIVGNLSGGQKKRIALAKLLLEKPDVILLDEPTNHLDIAAIEWLEKFLVDNFQTIVLITHDRYFLEAVTDQILELSDQKLYKHEGKYSDFLNNKLTRSQIAQVEKEKAKHLMKKELEWLRRQPQARGTKAKYRVDAFDGIKEKATANIDESQMELNIKGTRQGKKIIELHDVGHSFGNKFLFEHFNHKFAKGERVGIVGPNGTGKSTLLNILTGKMKPEKGSVAKGETTKVGYYTQESIDLNPANRIIDEVREIAEYIKLSDGTKLSLGKFLEQFLFDKNQQYAFIETLSGGERKRLQLLKVLLTEPNFLILDEPTNDFDIETLNVLEEYLRHYSGGLLVVTHDRYFLDRIVDHLFVFEGKGKIKDFPGNYTDYREKKKEEKALSQNTAKPKAKAQVQEKKETKSHANSNVKKLSYKEKREYEALEGEIAALETKKENLVAKLNSGEASHEELTEWAQEIEKLDNDIDTKTERWMELEERVS